MVADAGGALGKGYSKRGERSKGVPTIAEEGECSESAPRERRGLREGEEVGEGWRGLREPEEGAVEERAGGRSGPVCARRMSTVSKRV